MISVRCLQGFQMTGCKGVWVPVEILGWGLDNGTLPSVRVIERPRQIQDSGVISTPFPSCGNKEESLHWSSGKDSLGLPLWDTPRP